MKKIKQVLSTSFFMLLLISCSHNLFAQRNTTPGSHYKQKHSNKGTNRYSSPTPVSNTGAANTGAANDTIEEIKTGSEGRTEFMKKSGHPFGWPGYIVDYIVPLDKGGCDCSSNMQWITIEAAKAQGKLE